MFKHYFELIHGVDIYPIFSLLVFVPFFIGVFFWVFIQRKEHVQYMGNLPLSDASTDSSSNSYGTAKQ